MNGKFDVEVFFKMFLRIWIPIICAAICIFWACALIRGAVLHEPDRLIAQTEFIMLMIIAGLALCVAYWEVID